VKVFEGKGRVSFGGIALFFAFAFAAFQSVYTQCFLFNRSSSLIIQSVTWPSTSIRPCYQSARPLPLRSIHAETMLGKRSVDLVLTPINKNGSQKSLSDNIRKEIRTNRRLSWPVSQSHPRQQSTPASQSQKIQKPDKA
jgi:hypothetical protein